MNETMQNQITASEEQLRQAMLQSDTLELEELLAPELLFTNHIGQIMSKQDDIQAHKSGMVKIHSITLSEQNMRSCGDVVIVSTLAQINGEFNGDTSDSTLRFTRVWCQTPDGGWHVLAGHSSIAV